MSTNQFAMASEWMDNGNINEFIKAHRDENRFELVRFQCSLLILLILILAAQRCCPRIDIHARRRGNPRGFEGGKSSNAGVTVSRLTCPKANILVDQDGHARLADFGLTTIVSESTYPITSSSSAHGGTTRWMSPERLDPKRFGFKDGRPTKESDCYALGMVVLEVLSGQIPFKGDWNDYLVMQKVLEGKHPERPQGVKEAWFTDDLWEILEQCWSPQTKDRPIARKILEHLERVWTTWQPLPLCVDGDAETDSDRDSSLTVSSLGTFLHYITHSAIDGLINS